MSHLSDDEDELPNSPKNQSVPKTDGNKIKEKPEKVKKEEYIVKLRNIPPNSNKVGRFIALNPGRKYRLAKRLKLSAVHSKIATIVYAPSDFCDCNLKTRQTYSRANIESYMCIKLI